MATRTLHVRPEAVLELVKAISAADELLLAGESIPAEAALGQIRFNDTTRMFEIDLVSRWPKDTSAREIDFKHSIRRGPDLGPVSTLGAATDA